MLIDGASAHSPIIDPKLKKQINLARNKNAPLNNRVEAYEDIMASEIGDTSLLRIRNVERETGLRQCFLKFEGNNPTGTQKDRIAFAQAHDALRRGFDHITVATCGNYGVAISLAAHLAGLGCTVYIPEKYQTKRLDEMQERGAKIIRIPGDYEQAVCISQQRAISDEIYDANPGGINTTIQLAAYGEIASEIYDDLRDAPAIVSVPVSNGTTLAGIYKGFVRLYLRGKTSRIPKIVAGSSYGKNPIVHSFLKNLSHCEDLQPERIRETAVNEALINWHSTDGNLALEAIRKSQGWAGNVSDRRLLADARLINQKDGISPLPSSVAGFSILLDRHKQEPLPGDRYVAIITGRRV